MADGLRTAVLAGSVLTLVALLVERPQENWAGELSHEPFTLSEVRLVQDQGVGQKISGRTVDFVDRYELALIDGCGKEQKEVRVVFVTDPGRDLDGLQVRWNGSTDGKKSGEFARGVTAIACFKDESPVALGEQPHAQLTFRRSENGSYKLDVEVSGDGTRLRGTTEAKLIGEGTKLDRGV